MCIPGVSTWGEDGHDHSATEHKGSAQHQKDQDSLANVHLNQIPALLQTVKEAEKAIRSDDKEAALSALKQVKKQLQVVKQATGKHIQPLILNTKCPLMGDKIKLAKLTSKTVRPYKGKYVAFCCSDCGSDWDKLSDGEKEAKVPNASAKSVWTCSMHPEVQMSQKGSCPKCGMDLIPAAKSHEKENHSDHGTHDEGGNDHHSSIQ